MNPQIRNLLLALVLYKWAGRLDPQDERVILGARTAYLAFLVVALGINYLLRARVRAARDGRVLQMPRRPTMENPRPAAGETEQVSVQQYDESLLKAARTQLLMQTAFLAFFHWKMGAITPLVLQAVMGVFRQFDDPLVKIHLLGHAARGPLERPFKPEPNPLMQLLGVNEGAMRRTPSGTPTESAAPQGGAAAGTVTESAPGGAEAAVGRLTAAANGWLRPPPPPAPATADDLGEVTDSSADEAVAPDDEDDDEYEGDKDERPVAAKERQNVRVEPPAEETE